MALIASKELWANEAIMSSIYAEKNLLLYMSASKRVSLRLFEFQNLLNLLIYEYIFAKAEKFLLANVCEMMNVILPTRVRVLEISFYEF